MAGEEEPVIPRGIYAIGEVAQHFPREIVALLHPDGDGLELRKVSPGNYMVLLYTSYWAVAQWCGTGQPCAQIDTSVLVEHADDEGVRQVAVDMPLPEGHRYPVPDLKESVPLDPIPEMPFEADRCWVASRPFDWSHRHARPELLLQNGGSRRILLIYSSPEAVQLCCGPYQAAFPIRVEKLDELTRQSKATEVMFDTPIDPSAQHRDVVLD